MLLTMDQGRQPPRLTVFAYDMASPRRARRVRRLLESVHHAKQYSVFETLLGWGEFRGVLAEVTEYCDLSEDKLAVWWPRGAARLQWQQRRLQCMACGPQQAGAGAAAALKGIGNFVVCYDVSDPEALDIVASQIAAEGAMVQRSVYWLRTPSRRLSALLERCARHLAENDRLCAYPLRGAHDLWRIGTEASSLLPMATDRWPRGERR